MVFTNLCILVLWTKVALALEGLRVELSLPLYSPVYIRKEDSLRGRVVRQRHQVGEVGISALDDSVYVGVSTPRDLRPILFMSANNTKSVGAETMELIL